MMTARLQMPDLNSDPVIKAVARWFLTPGDAPDLDDLAHMINPRHKQWPGCPMVDELLSLLNEAYDRDTKDALTPLGDCGSCGGKLAPTDVVRYGAVCHDCLFQTDRLNP